MSETQELKLACLHHAGGDLDKAKAHYEWVIGSAPEASEQRATDQPEQPFNYRHPSKHDGSMPRRCYLDQLTPEELMIRDVAATVEGLGAHPLLTATVIKLMQAGEALADWVDIGLRDKAIQALLDPVPSPSPESSSQETVTEAEEASGEDEPEQGAFFVNQAGEIHELRGDGTLQKLADTPTEAERTSVVTDHDRVEPEPNFKEGEREAEAAEVQRFAGVPAWANEAWESDPLIRDFMQRPGAVWHDEGPMPFAGGTKVEVYFSGDIFETTTADSFDWNGWQCAYRVIEAPAETPPVVSELDSQETPQASIEQSQENPAAQMFGKALAAESEAKEQRKYNPFAIFGAKVDA